MMLIVYDGAYFGVFCIFWARVTVCSLDSVQRDVFELSSLPSTPEETSAEQMGTLLQSVSFY